MASFDKVIPPGQEGKVTLSVKTKNMSGKFSKSATIKSNDPKNPKLRIKLKGEVKKYISVKPSTRLYLTGYEGDIISKNLRIINHQDTPLKLTSIESTIDDKIDYDIKPVTEGKEYELVVKVKDGLKGRSNGKITVATNSEKKPEIEIRVTINFRDELTISPTTLYFGQISLTPKSGKPAAKLNLTKHLTIRKEKGHPLKIEKVIASSDLIQTKIEMKEEGKRYFIVVTLDKDKLKTGPFTETLEIHSNYKKKPVYKINVRGKVI